MTRATVMALMLVGVLAFPGSVGHFVNSDQQGLIFQGEVIR